MLGQHFLAAGAAEEQEEEVSKNTASNYGEEDAAPEEVVVGFGDDGDRDVTSDFVGEVDNNKDREDEYEGEQNSRFAFRLGCELDRRAYGGGGWRDGRLTALRLAQARLRREQQATFDGRCGDGIGGGAGCGGGGKKGQQIGLGGNGEEDGDDDDDYTEARDDDDEEEIEANDSVTCDLNQQVRSGCLCFLVFCICTPPMYIKYTHITLTHYYYFRSLAIFYGPFNRCFK